MVPNGWKKGLVSDLADTVMGYAFKSNDFVKKGIPLVRMGNLYQNQFQLDRSPIYLPDDFATEYKRFLLQSGDLVMSMTGTMGKRDYGFAVEIPENTQDCLLNQRVLKIEPRNSDAKGFVLNVLKSEIFLSKLYSLPGGTKQANLSATQIREISVLIPPLPEQQKIAKILSTWDKAISMTERLIDNSTQQKKALMQQLLTGKKRLLDESGKRFEGEWEDSKLGSLYSFKRGKGISKGQLTENGNKCVLYGELYTHYGEVIREVKSRTTETNSIKSIKGDVLIPASTTTTGIDLANATAILEDNILLGGDINILRPKKSIDAIFMAHLLTHTKKFEIARKGQGITIIHVYGKDLASLDVSIPSNLKEQQKIATVLINADKEIDLLEQQLADLQQEKKALMQVLLTGKKRVVVDGEVKA